MVLLPTRLFALTSFLGFLALSGRANAQAVESAEGERYRAPPTERRGGFHLGLMSGAGYGGVVGYPNKLGQIDNPAYRQSVGGLATATGLWLGGMLRDGLGVGVGASLLSALEKEQQAATFAFVLHVEAFPAFALGETWRDVGVLAEFGAGGGVVLDDAQQEQANGGALSVIGIGAFWEPWKFWHISAGPALQYSYRFSESMHAHGVSLGLRVAFYGVQP